jgi:hypothetical protein
MGIFAAFIVFAHYMAGSDQLQFQYFGIIYSNIVELIPLFWNFT